MNALLDGRLAADVLPPPLGVARPRASAAGVDVVWARHLDEVRAAQRLRYSVLAQEMGARLNTTVPGHDVICSTITVSMCWCVRAARGR